MISGQEYDLRAVGKGVDTRVLPAAAKADSGIVGKANFAADTDAPADKLVARVKNIIGE